MKKTIFTYLFTFVFMVSYSQIVTIKGKVVDSVSGLPLSFVNITNSDTTTGTYSDINGLFSLSLDKKECCLKVTYVGYRPKTYPLDFSKSFHLIQLKPEPVELQEVNILPGENPAHRIIQQAVKHKEANDPRKLKEYSYITYDKLNITVDAPELLEKDTSLLDSAEIAARNLLQKQDFFLMENVTRHRHLRPGYEQEKIMASRMSGFKDPVMFFLLSQLKSVSFYDPQINIGGKNYVSPLSKGSLKKYFFLLEDTLVNPDNDTTFIISFRPKTNKKFNALEGVLAINSNGWAIQNVKASPLKDTASMFITIEQSYQKTDSVWFPHQLKTQIVFKNLTAKIGKKSYHTVAKGTTYIKDINLCPDLKKRDFGLYDMEIEPKATRRNDDYWNRYRNDSLTEKELETYRVIDSLGQANHFDRTMQMMQSALTGKLPVGPVSIDLDKLFRYNVYEGIYLGVGLHTNQTFSKRIMFGGFAGYGFGDKEIKYGGDAAYLFHTPTESEISVEYSYEPLESGGVTFFSDKERMLSPDQFGDFFVERKNLTKTFRTGYSFRLRPLKDFKWYFSFSNQKKQAFGDYIFSPVSENGTPQIYYFTQLSFELRFAYHEKIVRSTQGNISLGSKFPVVSFKLTQGLKSVLKGEFSYRKFDLRITDRLETKYFGDFVWRLDLGLVDKALPASELYSARGTYRTFTLYAPYTFGTMMPNEFLSDRYASLFLTWDFKDLLVNIGRWKPRLLLLTNMGIGDLKHPEYHLNYGFKTMEKGFFESGFIIRRLINLKIMDFGAGIMYRYGPYSLPKTGDNFTYKFSIYYGF